MPQPIEQLLLNLDSDDPQVAWGQFLDNFADLIYQVAHHFESDPEKAADCFQFVCERLIENRARRLRKFKGDGAATFSTWLRAVVRNLCIDWHRREFGRYRPFRYVARLSTFDQEVFRLMFERGMSADESLTFLSNGFPNVTHERVTQSRDRIEQGLTDRQRWLLATRAQQSQGYGAGTTDAEQIENLIGKLTDPRPDPEMRASDNETLGRLRRALKGLAPQQRLLLLLRFEQGVTLQQAAQLLDLGNAQKADRILKEILARLRKELS